MSAQITTETYQVTYQPENLAITSQLNGIFGNVSVPISSTAGSLFTFKLSFPTYQSEEDSETMVTIIPGCVYSIFAALIVGKS